MQQRLKVRERAIEEGKAALVHGPAWPSPQVCAELVVDAVIDYLAEEVQRDLEPILEKRIRAELESRAAGNFGGLSAPIPKGMPL